MSSSRHSRVESETFSEGDFESSDAQSPTSKTGKERRKKRSRRANWQILEGLKEGQSYENVPKKFEGYILKKRRWPKEVYHKRYFVIDKGVITYGKNTAEISKGRIHGTMDAGLSVITARKPDGRIDIDSGDCIYHLKIKPESVFAEWLEHMRQHKLYRQHTLNSAPLMAAKGKVEVDLSKELGMLEMDISQLYGLMDSKGDASRDFAALSKKVLSGLHNVHDKLQSTIDASTGALRQAMNQAVQQNQELKAKLSRIHKESQMSSFGGHATVDRMASFLSSDSEYYDAKGGDHSSSEDEISSSDAEEDTSEHSDVAKSAFLERNNRLIQSIRMERRRANLPAPMPSGDDVPSLWGILKKNIGKDLGKVSMPVTMNEPLGVLQRVCEELEYCELLDSAAKENDPVERMALVAAFAVSAYANSFYRSQKPFNPILGETFECIRDDKGFRFIAEQVSHHPPITACHAEGRGWEIWGDGQAKTKFWGKSIEIQPSGETHVNFPKLNDHYTYGKATTSVHNIFTPASRWVDLYGEVNIVSKTATCKLTFVKASGGYFSSSNVKKHEVVGIITSGSNQQNLYGHWNEAFHVGQPPSGRCIWRMGKMPDDYAKYYGFTRFAIELNELSPRLKQSLPVTDSRLRPDQRLLESGQLNEAETAKQEVEQKQRERRNALEAKGAHHEPTWFKKSKNAKGEEQYEFNGSYWESRKAGFSDKKITSLW